MHCRALASLWGAGASLAVRPQQVGARGCFLEPQVRGVRGCPLRAAAVQPGAPSKPLGASPVLCRPEGTCLQTPRIGSNEEPLSRAVIGGHRDTARGLPLRSAILCDGSVLAVTAVWTATGPSEPGAQRAVGSTAGVCPLQQVTAGSGQGGLPPSHTCEASGRPAPPRTRAALPDAAARCAHAPPPAECAWGPRNLAGRGHQEPREAAGLATPGLSARGASQASRRTGAPVPERRSLRGSGARGCIVP